MQPGSGSGGRTQLMGIDSLVPFLILQLCRNIVGKGHPADFFQNIKKIAVV